jgi:hypothetical protein
MSRKHKGGKKSTAAKTAPRPLDEKTGQKVGSLGFAVGQAYLGETKHEKAVEAVEDVLRASAKAKGKKTTDEYVHGRAISWIGFLRTKLPKLYKELPSAEVKKEAVAA